MNCKACGEVLPDGSRFCLYCGTSVEKETEKEPAPGESGQEELADCQNCGAPLPIKSGFCPNCGAAAGQKDLGESEENAGKAGAPAQPRTCKSCGEELTENWRFCPRCGAEAAKREETGDGGAAELLRCPSCGEELPQGGRYCLYCGALVKRPTEARDSQIAPPAPGTSFAANQQIGGSAAARGEKMPLTGKIVTVAALIAVVIGIYMCVTMKKCDYCGRVFWGEAFTVGKGDATICRSCAEKNWYEFPYHK